MCLFILNCFLASVCMYSRSVSVCCCVLLDQSDAVFNMVRYNFNTSLRNGFTAIFYVNTPQVKLSNLNFMFLWVCINSCVTIVNLIEELICYNVVQTGNHLFDPKLPNIHEGRDSTFQNFNVFWNFGAFSKR